MNPAVDNRHKKAVLAAILLLGLLIRLPTIATGFHAAHDIDAYLRWGWLIEEHGLAHAYTSPEVDYPPLLLYLFGGATGLAVQAGQPVPSPGADRLATLIIQLPTALADVLTAGLLAGIVWRRARGIGVLVAGVYLFNPAVWYITAFWGQTDSIYVLLLLAGVVALARGAVLPAWVLYALALGSKLQSLALAPLFLAWSLRKHGLRGLLGGLAVGALTEAILAAPWLLAGRGDDLVRIFTAPVEKQQVVTAFNFWYLILGGDIRLPASLQPTPLPLSYQDFGTLLFAGLAMLVAGLALWRGGGLAAAAGALSLGMFLLVSHMHERHAFPVLAFLAWAGADRLAQWRTTPAGGSARPLTLWWIYGGLTLTILFNLITIVPFSPILGTILVVGDAGSPRWMILKSLSFVVALINILLLFGLLGYIGRGSARDPRTILAPDSPVP